jgi:hypothetical protein
VSRSIPFAAALLLTGCFRSLPPAEPPPARPLVEAAPPTPPGWAWVTLDAGPGRVRVDEVLAANPHDVEILTDFKIEKSLGRMYAVYTWQRTNVTDARLVPLCETPCALAMPAGAHDLHLQSIDDDEGRRASLSLDVTPGSRSVRVGLGRTPSPADWIHRFTVGFLLLTPGVSLLSVGAVDFAGAGGQPTPADQSRIQGDAVGLTISGGVLLAAGVIAFILTQPASQDSVVRIDGSP